MVSTLKTLVLRNSQLDNRKCKILIRGIAKCPLLENLELSTCDLGNDSGKSIGSLLQTNTTLKTLELKRNQLSEEGLQAIGYGLQCFSGELEYIGIFV